MPDAPGWVSTSPGPGPWSSSDRYCAALKVEEVSGRYPEAKEQYAGVPLGGVRAVDGAGRSFSTPSRPALRVAATGGRPSAGPATDQREWSGLTPPARSWRSRSHQVDQRRSDRRRHEQHSAALMAIEHRRKTSHDRDQNDRRAEDLANISAPFMPMDNLPFQITAMPVFGLQFMAYALGHGAPFGALPARRRVRTSAIQPGQLQLSVGILPPAGTTRRRARPTR